MKLQSIIISWIALSALAFAGDHLKLNSKLDYTSDSQDGPLITGEHMDAGFIAGKPAYVILYGEACYNSNRQERRPVDLYNKYKEAIKVENIRFTRQLAPASAEST